MSSFGEEVVGRRKIAFECETILISRENEGEFWKRNWMAEDDMSREKV
jgi:hypothetical protein